ncbi:RDD family protein, partial [Candidatus Sumerlaeota bacterium]|nr:RDD family protein [Candidatus Sumerlaeota bacterium]
MDWHYSDGKQQFGPVSEEEFNRMVTSGVIGPQTLVWRAGMENWQPYGQLTGPGAAVHAAAAPLAEAFSGAGHYCAECGHKFPDSDLIQYQEAWVCGNCKPIFFQKLREGMPVGNVMVFAGFWVRFGAKFIDNIILNVVGGIIRFAVMMAVGGGARGNPATLSDALADLTISLP